MNESLRSLTLLLVLLNPFLVIVYLVDVVEKLDARRFSRVLVRAGLIAAAVFCCFAVLGDAFFSDIVHADFASFQIFGGVVFLLIGLQFVFRGPKAIEILRGESEHLAGEILIPARRLPRPGGWGIVIDPGAAAYYDNCYYYYLDATRKDPAGCSAFPGNIFGKSRPEAKE